MFCLDFIIFRGYTLCMKKSWLNGKNVLLTGASSGIGKELALVLSRDYGCNVVGAARRKERLDELSRECENFKGIVADVRKRESWEYIKDELLNSGIIPDIVINNAGVIQRFAKLENITDVEADNIIATNYLSHLYCYRTMKELLKQSPTPAIVNVCSAAAFLPIGGTAVYSSSKSAAMNLSEAMREELMGEGFYVGYVMPGPVVTELYDADEDEPTPKADETVSAQGISAEVAARRIAKAISKKKANIMVDSVGRFMRFLKNFLPASSVKIMGKIMRKVKKGSLRDVYKDEEESK